MVQNRYLIYSFLGLALLGMNGCVKLNCPLPKNMDYFVKKETLSSASSSVDIKRNDTDMGGLCTNRISFYDNGKKWDLILVRNTKQPRGPFWYLPHDNENSAFDAAVYASKKYGGGFLSVEANGKRYASGIDPNRNFDISTAYTKNIFKIIDTFKPKNIPYMTLHSNKEGHMKHGGEGTVSMRITSSHTKSYPAGKIEVGRKKGLKDEDNLVYLAGKDIDQNKIDALNKKDIHVKYELIDRRSYDKSMSNYVALYKNKYGYVNIETEDGDTSTQKVMIDKVMKLIYQGSL